MQALSEIAKSLREQTIPTWWVGVWLAIFVLTFVFVVGISKTSNLSEFASAMFISIPITFLSFLPLLLFLSFTLYEREGGRLRAVGEVTRNGWEAELLEDVEHWHASAFERRRYPIPVTILVLTFLGWWIFGFFHSGYQGVHQFAEDSAIAVFINSVRDAPPIMYGFLGAYTFAVGFLFSRYINGDLAPQAYINLCIRTWTIVIVVLVISTVWEGTPQDAITGDSSSVLVALAFIGGVFPNVLWEWLMSAFQGVLGSKKDRTHFGKLENVEGLTHMKTSRLIEEGIENVQNLALEDPGRLIVVTQETGLRVLDWIDQAILMTAAANSEEFNDLTKLGIKRAYDLYRSCLSEGFEVEADESTGAPRRIVRVPEESRLAAYQTVLLNVVSNPNFERVRRMYLAAHAEAASGREPAGRRA